MSEFNNRIAAQRDILICINGKAWEEELFGLSSGAIERWINVNGINANSALAELAKNAAAKLFFLSNKSQEQITEDYKKLSSDVSEITQKIKIEMKIIER